MGRGGAHASLHHDAALVGFQESVTARRRPTGSLDGTMAETQRRRRLVRDAR